MEETHQKKIEDLQRQHQRELEKLREEKDRLLAEETAATISGGPALVASLTLWAGHMADFTWAECIPQSSDGPLLYL